MNDLIDGYLSDFALFVRVVNAGGFTAASRQTKMPQATVSRRIAQLEEKLGARLLNRNTRNVALTETGRRVYEHARLMVEQGEAAGASIDIMQAAPTGTLKITSTVALGQYFLSDLVARFMSKYPNVFINVELTSRSVDILGEGFDIAVRVGKQPDSGLALTRIRTLGVGFYATPSYLQNASPLNHPNDLENHPILAFSRSVNPLSLKLAKDKSTKKVALRPVLSSNDIKPIFTAVLRDLGVAMLPKFVGDDLISNEQCVEVLNDWHMPEIELNALTPSFKGEVPAVKQFLAMARDTLNN